MKKEVTLRIVLENPVTGVVYGIQKGKGNNYETMQKQTAGSSDLLFEFPVSVELDKNQKLVFKGPFVQGPPQERFLYIDIGTCAGQLNTPWSRRLKIPIAGISATLISNLSAQDILVTRVPGTAKDGGPNCATVKPFAGWELISVPS